MKQCQYELANEGTNHMFIPHCLVDGSLEVRQVLAVIEVWKSAVTDDAVDLLLSFPLSFGEQHHHRQEVHERGPGLILDEHFVVGVGVRIPTVSVAACCSRSKNHQSEVSG